MNHNEKTVAIHYTLTLESGEEIESNLNEEPLQYTLGSGELLPGLEEIVQSMEEGERQEGVLPPEQGYGPHNPEALIEIPREHLPPEAWNIGARLQAAGPKGEQIEGVVHSLREHCAVVDFNHPLAGKNLVYSLQRLPLR